MNIKKKIIILIATWFGFGFMPVAPGTFGSLIAVFIIFLLKDTSITAKTAVLGLIIIAGILTAQKACHIFNSNDPKPVVIDEVAGMMVSAIFLPFCWKYILSAFVIFRILDIIKPFPVNRMEDLKSGIGIMADDIVAGIITYGLMLFFFILSGHRNL